MASALLGFSMLHASHVLTSPAHIRAGERRAVLLIGGVSLRVHVADTQQRRRAGLMDDVPQPGTGELFAWRSDLNRHFWMWRTPAALDMIFLDRSGRVVDVLASVPPCYVKPCAVFSERAHYAVDGPVRFRRCGARPCRYARAWPCVGVGSRRGRGWRGEPLPDASFDLCA
ncbi:protein containing DUF192, partial [mine drainage metagenome]